MTPIKNKANKKLKILIVSAEYPPETGFGGIATYVYCLAPALTARGHEVHVLSCYKNQQVRDLVDKNVFIHRRPSINLRGSNRVIKLAKIPHALSRFEAGLSAFFKSLELNFIPDVVYFMDWGAEGWFFTFLDIVPTVARIAGPIFSPHYFDDGFEKLYSKRDFRLSCRLEYFSLHHASQIVASSRMYLNILKNEGWNIRPAVNIIPNPIDGENWAKVKPVIHTKPVVLFLGRLGGNKAPELLVEAIAMIRKKIPTAEGVFVGSQRTRREKLNYLEWLNKKYKNLNGCKFIDHVPRGKLGIYFSKCRVLAMPSWIESYGNSALEVMAAGRPVVVTSTMGVSELVRESGNGTVIPPGDSRALAQALLPYLLDTNHAQQAGLKAKNVVNRVNNPDIIAEQIEKTFIKAIYSYHQKNLSKYKCRIYRTFKKLI